MFRKVILSFLFIFCLCGFTFAQQGSGIGSGTGSGSSNTVNKSNQPLTILSKPQASYTDKARTNNVQGVVILRVIFLKTGKIGEIKVVVDLPDGLSEQAVKAAEKIRFRPQTRNGQPVTVTKNISYTFTIY